MPRIALTLAVCCLLAGCGSGASGATGLQVVATTPVAADLVRNVAGPGTKVTALIPANADPHEYEPRPRDIAALTAADLVVRSGGDLDDWLTDALAGAGSDARELNLIDQIAGRVKGDPHWWHDPQNAIEAVQRIRDELTVLEPERREAYATRAAAYVDRIRRLDAGIRRCIDSIPAARRKLVTSHDALGYFARRYGLEVIGTVIPSLSTQSQASAGETAALVTKIRATGVPVIFAETAVNPKVERAIAREAGAKVGPQLYADGLGPAGSDGATYVAAMAANTLAIGTGLGGGAACSRVR